MATTSTKLVLVSDDVKRGGFGMRFGMRAKVALGVATLGCAAALVFGGLRAGNGGQSPAVAPVAATAAMSVREQMLFLEQNLTLPESTLPVATLSRPQWYFLELNTMLPDGGTLRPLSFEEFRFLEQNLDLPYSSAAAPLPQPAHGNGQADEYQER